MFAQAALFARMEQTLFNIETIDRRTISHIVMFQVTSVALSNRRRTVDFRYAPLASEDAWRCNMSRRAMCGRLRVGKENLRRWSERPCVRPVCAVLMTAGHNALRGSGPGQEHAFEDAMALVGCLDRRIDRRCIKCSSPSQPLRHTGYPV
jgi:hypothetical protein